MHATQFLKKPKSHDIGPIVALYGNERYLQTSAFEALKQVVLEGDDLGLTRFEGKNAELKTVCDELLTVSMWGDKRLVVIDDADEFVSQNRSGLEKYVEKPARKSVLVLLVKKWPKTTRLAKAVAKVGLDIHCDPLKGAELTRWLTQTSQELHEKTLSRDAAQLMIELAGNDLGLLERELAKLAAFVGDIESIGAEDVSQLVGGWKTETTWAMINALRDGRIGVALSHLNALLDAGEAPQKILGGLNFVFRKLATAVEGARGGTPLRAALSQAGVFPRDIQPTEQFLRRIGRVNAEKFLTHLLQADGDLKGNARLPERLLMERLLVQLSGVAMKKSR